METSDLIPDLGKPNEIDTETDTKSGSQLLDHISIWKTEFVKQSLWVAGRVSFVIALILLTMMIRQPIEDIIKKDLLSNVEKIENDKEIQTLEQLNSTKALADNAYQSITNIINLILIKRNNGYSAMNDDLLIDLKEKIYLINSSITTRSNWRKEYESLFYKHSTTIEGGYHDLNKIWNVFPLSEDMINKLTVLKDILERQNNDLDKEYYYTISLFRK